MSHFERAPRSGPITEQVIWNRRRLRIHFGGCSRFDHELALKPHLFLRDGRWRVAGMEHVLREAALPIITWIAMRNSEAAREAVIIDTILFGHGTARIRTDCMIHVPYREIHDA